MCLSFLLVSIGMTDACFTLLGKVFVSVAVLITSAIGSNKKLIAIFTSLRGILSTAEALSTLMFFISFSTSWTFTLVRTKQVGLFKLSLIFIILGCVSYLMILQSIADKTSTFVSCRTLVG